jgi:hypothetical protein
MRSPTQGESAVLRARGLRIRPGVSEVGVRCLNDSCRLLVLPTEGKVELKSSVKPIAQVELPFRC